MPTFSLVPHPDFPTTHVDAVIVRTSQTLDGTIEFEYRVNPAERLLLPSMGIAERADGLWKATCFEMFFKPAGGQAYREFNFSPSFEWAAYSFDAYREGMKVLDAEDPDINVFPAVPLADGEQWFFLSAEPWPPSVIGGSGTFGLSAVIEEIDGTKSYWALAHAPGPPDFHNPACFTATLPPPQAA